MGVLTQCLPLILVAIGRFLMEMTFSEIQRRLEISRAREIILLERLILVLIKPLCVYFRYCGECQ